MANLINKLNQAYKGNRLDSNQLSAVTEAQRLIANNGAEDMGILRSMGMHRSVELAIENQGKKIELENMEKEHGQLFTREDIKKVACKYALKFLRSEHYKGAIDPVMLTKVKEFLNAKDGEINHSKLGFNFYILAPSSAFNLTDRPKPIDPILFYKMDGDNYKMIHKWGSDLTPLRRLIGVWNSSASLRIFLLSTLIYGTLLFSIIMTAINDKYFPKGQCSSWALLVVISSIVSLVYSMTWGIEGLFNKMKPWSEHYTEPYRV